MIGHNHELQVYSYGGHISETNKRNPASKKSNDEDSQQAHASVAWAMPSLVTHRQKSSYPGEEYNVTVPGLEASGGVNPRINAIKFNLRGIESEHDGISQSSEKFSDNEGKKALYQKRAEVILASHEGDPTDASTSIASSHHDDIGTSFEEKYEVGSRVSSQCA